MAAAIANMANGVIINDNYELNGDNVLNMLSQANVEADSESGASLSSEAQTQAQTESQTEAETGADAEMFEQLRKQIANSQGVPGTCLTGPAIQALMSGYNPMKTACGRRTGYGRALDDHECCCKCPLAQKDIENSLRNRTRRLAFYQPNRTGLEAQIALAKHGPVASR